MSFIDSNEAPVVNTGAPSPDQTKDRSSSKTYENPGQQDLNSVSVLDAARSYWSLGWQPIPLHPRSKAAMKGWNTASVPEFLFEDTFRDDRNIGVVFGAVSGGLVDVDIDDPDALLIAGHFLPKTETVFGRETARDAHRLYRLPDNQEMPIDKLIVEPGAIEMRSAKHQTMVPPSIHPNGEQLAWSSFGDPTEIEWSELRAQVGWLAAAVLLGRNWQSWPHQKHDISLALSGALLRSGATVDEVKRLLEVVCFLGGDSDVKDRLRAVDTTVKKLDDGEPVKGWPALRDLVGSDIEKKLIEFIPVAVKPEARLVPLTDLWYVAPENRFYYQPTGEMWLQQAVNAAVPPVQDGFEVDGKPKFVRASTWLGQNRRAESVTWWPGKPVIIEDHVFTEGGLRYHPDTSTLNSYRPPVVEPGDSAQAGPWVDHVHRLYLEEADEILDWLAYKVQHPGDKINHALVLGGHPGVGKDTILHPVRVAVGPWNMSEARPTQIMGEQFDSYQKAVILRVNEASDLGDGTRTAFGNHMKNIIADPPEVLSVNEKHRQRHYIPNLVGVVYTSNERLGALFLEDRDRRHLCCWSELTSTDFTEAYFESLYGWLEAEGDRHVAAFLRERDLSAFNPKAAPRKTDWFYALVDSGKSSEEGGFGAVLEALGEPDAVTTMMIKEKAGQTLNSGEVLPGGMFSEEIYEFLNNSKNNSKIKHFMQRAGYEKVDNPEAPKSKRWRIAGIDTVIYAKASLTVRDQIAAARGLVEAGAKPIREFRRSS